MLTHRLGRAVVRLASAVALLGLVGALPTALAAFVGWPLPRTVPTDWTGWSGLLTGGFPDTAVINLLAVALWLTWAAFCYSLIGEILAVRRGRPARHVRVISPLQALAALLIAGLSTAPAAASVAVIVAPPPAVSQTVPTAAPTVAGTATVASAASAASADALPWLTVTAGPAGQRGASATTNPVVVTVAPVGTGAVADTAAGNRLAALPRFAAVAHTGPLTLTAGGQQYTVTVERGDTLWEIAEAWLGDPHRWPEIYHLNADRYDDDGRMRGGDHIEPTWVLVLPDDATPPPGAQPAPPPGNQQPPGTGEDPGQPAAPPSTAPPSVAPPSTTAPSAPAPSAPSTQPPGTAAPSITAPPGDDGVYVPPGTSTSPSASATPGATSTAPAPASNSATEPGEHDDSRDGADDGVALLSGSWVDVGLALALVAAVALVWAHRRRRYTPRPPSAQPRLDDPDLAPMPPVVTNVRRGLRGRLRRPVPQPAPNDDLDLFADDPVGNHRVLERPDLEGGHNADLDADFDPVSAPPASEAGLDADPYGADLYVRDLYDEDDSDDDEPTDDEDEYEEGDGDVDGGDADDELGADRRPAPVPVVPALTNPVMAVWPPAGLGLTGPRAEDAARGFLAAALAAGGVDEPDARTHVVMPSATAATLLGAAAVGLPDTPRLTITAGLDEALELLEAQTLHRTRLVYRHEVDTVAQLRTVDPLEEPVEPLLLIADATTGHARARIAALLAQGQRLDIHGVLLGVWPDGNTVVVDADGTTRPRDGDHARHGHHPGDIGRLAVLTPAETADIVALLAESHTGQPPAPAPTEPHPATAASGSGASRTAPAAVAVAVDERPDTEPGTAPADTSTAPLAGTSRAGDPARPVTGKAEPAQPVAAATAGQAADPVADADDPVGDDQAAQQDHSTGQSRPVPSAPWASDADVSPAAADAATTGSDSPDGPDAEPSKAASATVVKVRVLGPPEIVDMDTSKGSPRRKSMEVLVYLAVHDGQIHYESILEDVLPDALAQRAPHRLHTYVSDLRQVLRRTAGPGEYVPRLGERYTLNRDLLDVDLWRMQQALREAEQATDPDTKITALRRVIDEYRGDLADGTGYEWLEPYREAARQQVLDAVLALADANADRPADAIEVLEPALAHNPYTEALYEAAMRAHAARRDVEAIRRLRRTLTRRLAEIDTEPTEEITALADQLIARLQAPPRRTGPRPAADPGEDAAA